MVLAMGRPTKGTDEVELMKVGSEIMFLLTVMRRRLPPGVTRPVSAPGVVRPFVVGAAGKGPVGGAGDGGNAELLDMAGEGAPGKEGGRGDVGRPRPPADEPMGGRGEGRGAPIAGEAPCGPEAGGGGIMPSRSCGGKGPLPENGPFMTGVGGAF